MSSPSPSRWPVLSIVPLDEDGRKRFELSVNYVPSSEDITRLTRHSGNAYSASYLTPSRHPDELEDARPRDVKHGFSVELQFGTASAPKEVHRSISDSDRSVVGFDYCGRADVFDPNQDLKFCRYPRPFSFDNVFGKEPGPILGPLILYFEEQTSRQYTEIYKRSVAYHREELEKAEKKLTLEEEKHAEASKRCKEAGIC